MATRKSSKKTARKAVSKKTTVPARRLRINMPSVQALLAKPEFEKITLTATRSGRFIKAHYSGYGAFAAINTDDVRSAAALERALIAAVAEHDLRPSTPAPKAVLPESVVRGRMALMPRKIPDSALPESVTDAVAPMTEGDQVLSVVGRLQDLGDTVLKLEALGRELPVAISMLKDRGRAYEGALHQFLQIPARHTFDSSMSKIGAQIEKGDIANVATFLEALANDMLELSSQLSEEAEQTPAAPQRDMAAEAAQANERC